MIREEKGEINFDIFTPEQFLLKYGALSYDKYNEIRFKIKIDDDVLLRYIEEN